MTVKLQQRTSVPSEKEMDQFTHVLIILPENPTASLWNELPYGDTLKKRNKSASDNNSQPLVTDLPNGTGTRVTVVTVNPDSSTFDLLGLGRQLVAPALQQDPKTLALIVHGLDAEPAERVAEAVIAATMAATATMPSYKSDRQAEKKLSSLRLFGVRSRHGFRRTFAEGEGNALARRLSMMPSNKLTPTEYLREVRKLAKQHGWKLEFYGVDELKRRKAGAFLAVAQGSPKADAGIVRLRYTPGKKSNMKPVFLVGKGICFDTGGTNLKPHQSMYGMQEDMQGSSVALGTLLALTELQIDYPVEAWLALAMNHIGPNAYKPNDVVTASDGTTIEVVHTDAEGRMVLADTLVQASKARPRLIIDYATLTGTCVAALGRNYAGVFTNRDAWNTTLIEAGRASGERVWPFPMDSDYEKGLESHIADTRQCAPEGPADHIVAARFLQRFVKNDTPWVHVDLAPRHVKGGLAHIPTDTTGFGVRYTLNLLLDQKLA